MEKQELIKELEGILPVMRETDKYLETLETIEGQLISLRRRYEEPYRWKNLIDFMYDMGLGVFGGIFLAEMSIYLMGFLIGFETIDGVVALIGAIVEPTGAIVGGIIQKGYSNRCRAKDKEKLGEEIEVWQKEYNQAESEMIHYLAPYWTHILSLVPQKYANPMAVQYIYDYLIDGRADSVKEAINLFEEEQHRWRVEENQRQMQEEYRNELKAMQEAQERLESRVRDAERAAETAYYELSQYENYNY